MTRQSVKGSRLGATVEGICAVLLIATFLCIQVLIGGTRLIFALPCYGLLAVIGILCLLRIRAPKPAPDAFCLWTTLIFFGYIVGRAVCSPVAYLARIEICSIVAGLIVYVLASCVLTSARTRMVVFASLLAATIAHVFVGAIQFRGGNNYMPISFLQRFDYAERASGFYICPNHLAGLLE